MRDVYRVDGIDRSAHFRFKSIDEAYEFCKTNPGRFKCILWVTVETPKKYPDILIAQFQEGKLLNEWREIIYVKGDKTNGGTKR